MSKNGTAYGAIICVDSADTGCEICPMDCCEIWQAAQFLVREYDDPELVAARRLDSVIAARLPAAQAAWKSIFNAIQEWQRVELLNGERVH